MKAFAAGSAPGSGYIAGMRYSQPSPFEREHPRRRRFRAIPVRTLVPNVITLLALCAGLTAIRFAAEGTLDWALYAIVFAALLDGIDGRVARMLKGTSRFGAELDSLADFVNFGVAPAVILYFWDLHEVKSAGWIAAMVFAIAAGLRLARFNVMVDDPSRPAWAGNFFTGIPAPAGAITVLLPVYVTFLGVPKFAAMAPVTLVYTLAIAFLMVSRLPVFSGKKLGTRVPPDLVLPVFIGVVLFFAVLIAYPWLVLTVGTLMYLACLPLGWLSHRGYVRRDAAAFAAGRGRAADKAADASPPPALPPQQAPSLPPRPPLAARDENPTRH
jgi:CDP-diacylglycerol---serine O-phosphatidyltransferase